MTKNKPTLIKNGQTNTEKRLHMQRNQQLHRVQYDNEMITLHKLIWKQIVNQDKQM